ncbi:hypothetical protein PRIPAC_94201 [Pristionchus pacificus]|uniref:BTB domain-containing protein n=1 Tax=Pristionchus pacificus TaxID=54126 RepID=A0A2A6BIR9_PRIPA|nr:hypothetical protein PRIPAC_94201 [Pristionchus pacificus]|eukprot:PDM65691.1 BTB domain-containing protein [Pristionchus pacificus]
MDKKSQEHLVAMRWVREVTCLDVKITPSEDGNKYPFFKFIPRESNRLFFIWRSRPIMGLIEPRDGILLIEDTKIYTLASQSSYFDCLFNGDFKEKTMDDMPIGDVSAKEFTNLLRIMYGETGSSVVDSKAKITGKNVHRLLALADRFDLKRRMSAPPAKESKVNTTRLRLSERSDGMCELFVRCEKSMEAELWDCEADIRIKAPQVECSTTDKKSQEVFIGVFQFAENTLLTPVVNSGLFHIQLSSGCRSSRAARWNSRVRKKKKLYVNKESLASQSSFFDSVFEEYMNTKNAEITLGCGTAEEFSTLMKMVYGENGTSVVNELLTQHNVLHLAEVYKLKIVEDGVANWLLSPSCPLSIHERLIIIEGYERWNITDRIISLYTDEQLKELSEADELNHLSSHTLRALFKKSCSAKANEQSLDSASGDVNLVSPKVEEECSTISMVVGEGNCLSPVVRIKGYPWRFRLFKRDDGLCELFVRCDKSMEAELWTCQSTIYFKDLGTPIRRKFESTDKEGQEQIIGMFSMFKVGTRLDVVITPDQDGNKYGTPRDGILLIEDKKIYSLASQSSYFDRLFNGHFKEKNMEEIPIGDVSAEEFINLLRMLYGQNGASVVDAELTRDNVHRVLELADRFDLKVVEEGVVNVLLSSSSSFSIHVRLLIADQRGLDICKGLIISQYTSSQLRELSEAPEYGELSNDTKDSLFKKSCVNSSGDDVDAPQEEEGKATRIRFHGGFFAFIFLLFRSECSTISVVVGKGDCLSPITRIKGYPWRLRLFKRDDGFWDVFVRCEKSIEAEFWGCDAVIKTTFRDPADGREFKFSSMDKQRQEQRIGQCISEGTRLEVDISPSKDGNKLVSIVIIDCSHSTFFPCKRSI